MAANSPVTKPSSSTERNTCLRDAPSVRSVASSRTRCATVIESVLKMTNEPTIRAIPANASRRYWKNVSPSLISVAAALPGRVAGLDLSRGRQQRLDLVGDLGLRDARLRRHVDDVELALLVEQLLRRGHVEDGEGRAADRVDRAELGDAGDGHVPLRPLAATRRSCRRPCSAPSWRCRRRSRPGRGRPPTCPDFSVVRVRAAGPARSPSRSCGCCVLPSCLPSRPISFTKSLVPLMSKIAPEALLTSGSAATLRLQRLGHRGLGGRP